MAHSSDIRSKDVINIRDGRRLGAVSDIEFNPDGQIASLTVPVPLRFSDLLRGDRGGITIPWEKVVLLGEDVILVRLDEEQTRAFSGEIRPFR